MGPKRNKHEKAALRKAKASARKERHENNENQNDQNVVNNDEFEDDVPKMKVQLEKLGLVLKEVEGDG